MDSGVRIGALFCAAAAAGAVVLFSPNPPTASALPGSFTYTNGQNQPTTSSSPPSGRCVPLVGSGPVKNMTSAKVTLYNATTCELKNEITDVGAMKTKEQVPTFQAAYWEAED